MSARLEVLRDALNASLIERGGEVEAMLLAAIAREHVLLVGPPGTAKSRLVTSLTNAIDGAHSFSVLLTKFTTPEEVFGPVKLSALREDRYERAIEGYAPTAHICFFDEIFKASSAILNTLLTQLQERVFDNGGVRINTPLRLAVAASNEWPSSEDGQELGALFDRFLIRRVVKPVSPAGRQRLLFEELPEVLSCTPLETLDAAAEQAAAIPFDESAKVALAEILDKLAGAGILPGDRRARKAVGIARAAAWIQHADAVLPAHLEALADVLWAAPEQAEQCTDIVMRIANPVGAALADLLRDVDEITASAVEDDAGARMSAVKKLEACEKRAAKLQAEGGPRANEILRHVKSERIRIQAAALGIDPAKAAQLLEATA